MRACGKGSTEVRGCGNPAPSPYPLGQSGPDPEARRSGIFRRINDQNTNCLDEPLP